MLTRAENELFTRSRRVTPMGELLRPYWMPVPLGSATWRVHTWDIF